MNKELKMLWKEIVMPNLWYYPSICLEKLRKATDTFSPESRSPG
jgi:hypothetical protein